MMLNSFMLLLGLGILLALLDASDGTVRCFRKLHERTNKCKGLRSDEYATAEDCCSTANSAGYYNQTGPVITVPPYANVYECTLCDRGEADNVAITTTTTAPQPAWNPWSDWSECNATCGEGTMTRSRTCRQGVCDNDNERSKNCPGLEPCATWNSWSGWSECSATCGEGTMTRTRTCHQGACDNDNERLKNCPGLEPCPRWGNWSQEGVCTASCGEGMMTFTRECLQGDCIGSSEKEMRCPDLQPCPINGEWGGWSIWYPCTVPCGGGEQVRVRSCDQPEPQHGGFQCPSQCFRRRSCNGHSCPVNGQWSEWGGYSRCSVSCGDGEKTRRRLCNNPPRQHGGAECEGELEEHQPCHPRSCQVHGGWSAWGEWTSCTVSCGEGSKQRGRSCNNPTPQHGGNNCGGPSTETLLCVMTANCPVDGVWSEWNEWGRCPARPCSQDMRFRLRNKECNNPPAQHGGAPCLGGAWDRKKCFGTEDCPNPADGSWCGWGAWGDCTHRLQVRYRQCGCPPPNNGGQLCAEDESDDSIRSEAQASSQACVVEEVVNPVDPSASGDNQGSGDDDDDDDDAGSGNQGDGGEDSHGNAGDDDDDSASGDQNQGSGDQANP